MIIPLEAGALPLGVLGSLLGTSVPPAIGGVTPSRLVTDAREIQKGDLFCALKDKRDGHAYIPDAVARGAVATIAERRVEGQGKYLLVPSVRAALAKWAAAVTRGNRPVRIGITGSVGKTTTKDAVAALLSVRFQVHATYGNRNNDLGVPFTLLSAPKETEMLVTELGISNPGEMRVLSETLRPHLAVITCIGHAHVGAFGSREAIAEEKRRILQYAAEEATLLVPVREPLLAFLPPHGIRRCEVTPFQGEDFAAYGLADCSKDVARSFSLAYAAAIGKLVGLTEEELREGLTRATHTAPRRREEALGSLLLIDDGYNASPESMVSALLYLSEKGGKRVAVLGDMLELGERSEAFHRAVGRFAARHASLLFFFGAYAKEYARGARSAGACEVGHASKEQAEYAVLRGDCEEMAKEIAARLSGNETVLFKASRALRIEKIVTHLKESLR